MLQKHIFVVDGLWVGHHEIYLKTIVRDLLQAGYQVSALCPEPNELFSWVKKITEISDCPFKSYYYSEKDIKSFRFFPARCQNYLYSLLRWFHLARTIKTITDKPDFVFIAWLDSYLIGYLPRQLIDWRFPYKWSGLYFHPRHLRGLDQNGCHKKRRIAPAESFLLKSRQTSSVCILDAGVASKLRSNLNEKQVFVFPDFTDEIQPLEHYHLADEIREKANGRIIISLLGGLARRKGLLSLIKIVKESARYDWFFVVAGDMMEHTYSNDELKELYKFINTPKDNCYFHLKRIKCDSHFNALVKLSDILFAVYESFFHSSNLVTKSAIYNKRILVNTEGYMSEVVNQYKFGEAVPVGDIKAAVNALHRLASIDCSNETLNGMKKYAREQSQEKLQCILLSLIEHNVNILQGQ